MDSARYMLSALIQSEAAIIAIVVTMSLVAAQLAASLYSVRVTNIFRNSPDLWILMLIYGIVLFWGLGVLKLIEKADPQCASYLICQSNLQGYIALTYSLGIFAFVSLAPYMWNIFGMLNASTITTKCAKSITKQSILKSTTTKNPADDDSFLTIIDIMKSSLIKYDYGTLETGLKAIEERVSIILENESLNADEELKISDCIFGHLELVGKLALSRGDEYSSIQVINTIQEIGDIAAENRFKIVTYYVLFDLKLIGMEAINRNIENTTQMAIKHISNIGMICIEKGLYILENESGSSEVFYLVDIGRKVIGHRLENTAQQVALLLGCIGIEAVNKELTNTVSNSIEGLDIIGECAWNEGLYEVMLTTKNSLDLIVKTFPPELESERSEAANALKKINAYVVKYQDDLKSKRYSNHLRKLSNTKTIKK